MATGPSARIFKETSVLILRIIFKPSLEHGSHAMTGRLPTLSLSLKKETIPNPATTDQSLLQVKH